jgi:sodium transport system ATP-binding protein
MIEIKDLRKSYGEVEALKDVSFDLNKGEIVALLGGNGSGKSTTINILTGLLKPDFGTVSIGSNNPFENPVAARKKIGVFPDQAGLFPNLTVREHFAFFAGLHGLKGSGRRDAIDKTIELLALEEIADRIVKGFSHGQAAKVALGRAIIHNPEFLILDEPSRGLDVFAIRQLRDILLTLKSNGVGVLFSSHVMQEVEILADRLVVISNGFVCAVGTSDELKSTTNSGTLEDAFLHLAKQGAESVS